MTPATPVVSADPDVRIAARKLSTGKIEFALQQQGADDVWGDPLLPTRRRFPTTARVDHWLQSTPLTITVAESAEDFIEDVQVRIIARKLEDGRVEFGIQQRGRRRLVGRAHASVAAILPHHRPGRPLAGEYRADRGPRLRHLLPTRR